MSDENEPPTTNRICRRRLLAFVGTGALGSTAGCIGGDDPGTSTDTLAETESGTSTDTPTGTKSGTAIETESATTDAETDTPTETESDADGPDDGYACPQEDAAFDVVVAADGSGDYASVQAAIDAIPDGDPEETRVHVRPGTYEEKLDLPPTKLNVTFVGDDPEATILTYDDHADKTDDSGDEIGTTGSSSFFVWGPDFTARNLTFENAAEPVAQAVAIRVDGDRAVFENCRFLGHQDTLYTHGEDSRQYYRDCYVEGDVDFIFGASTAVFEDCEIFCKAQGYVTAASTPESSAYGYLFTNCEITGSAHDDSVYLGRPWGPHAKTAFVNCYLGEQIHPDGWEEWDGREKTASYAEYDNEGPGYRPNERVPWSSQMGKYQAEYYTIEQVLGGWNPRRCFE